MEFEPHLSLFQKHIKCCWTQFPQWGALHYEWSLPTGSITYVNCSFVLILYDKRKGITAKSIWIALLLLLHLFLRHYWVLLVIDPTWAWLTLPWLYRSSTTKHTHTHTKSRVPGYMLVLETSKQAKVNNMELLKTAPWKIKSGAKMETEAEESTANGNFWKVFEISIKGKEGTR